VKHDIYYKIAGCLATIGVALGTGPLLETPLYPLFYLILAGAGVVVVKVLYNG
jgi:hypothetical protein